MCLSVCAKTLIPGAHTGAPLQRQWVSFLTETGITSQLIIQFSWGNNILVYSNMKIILVRYSYLSEALLQVDWLPALRRFITCLDDSEAASFTLTSCWPHRYSSNVVSKCLRYSRV